MSEPFVNRIPPSDNELHLPNQYRPERQIWDKAITLQDLFAYWNKIGDLMKELDSMDVKILDFHTGKDDKDSLSRLDIYLKVGMYPENMSQQATEDFLYTWWNELKAKLKCGLYILPIKDIWVNIERYLIVRCYIMEPREQIHKSI